MGLDPLDPSLQSLLSKGHMKPTTGPFCTNDIDSGRRRFLRNGLYAAAGFSASGFLPPRIGVAAGLGPRVTGPAGDILICLFIRGAADVLNIIPPYADPGYQRLRPMLAVAAPDDSSVPAAQRALDLGDGLFGLHPALSSLLPLYQDGRLVLLTGAGSPDPSRSHFNAQDMMETAFSPDYTGWLGRHLSGYDTGNPSSLRGTGTGDVLQLSLAAPVGDDFHALLLPSIDSYKLPSAHPAAFRTLIDNWYADDAGPLSPFAAKIFSTIDVLSTLPPAVSGNYPDTDFGRILQDVGRLIKADLGLEVACVDSGGWDTHVNQGLGGDPAGYLSKQLRDLGDGLAALVADLGPLMDRVTIVAMSEFGRQLKENTARGTDHGRGGLMFLLGNSVRGGRVFTHQPWQPLDALDGDGKVDLDLLTDYRDVLSEILLVRMGNPDLMTVFPGYSPTLLGLVD